MDLYNLYYMFLMVAGIGVIIFVHELGHFLVAKWADVKVEAFSLGFGPALIQKRVGETVYKVCIIPLGGYVKMTGENPGEASTGDPREFSAKGVGARAAIISAGVVMNILFACIIFPVVFSLGVKMDAPVVGDVEPGMPAWTMGIQPGDKIVSVNGRKANSFEDVVFEVALSDGPVRLELDRNGKRDVVNVTPEYDKDNGFPRIGLRPAWEIKVKPLPGKHVEGLPRRLPVVEINGIPTDDYERINEVLRAQSRSGTGTPEDMLMVVDDQGVRTTLTIASRREKTDPWFLGVEFPPTNEVEAIRLVGSGEPVLNLARGDRVVAVNGQSVNNRISLEDAVMAAPEGAVTMTLVRLKDPDREVQVAVEALADPATRKKVLKNILFKSDKKRTVVVPIKGLDAEQAGFRADDRIVKADGKPVKNAEQIQTLIKAYDPKKRPDGFEFEVERTVRDGDQRVLRTVKLTAAPARMTRVVQVDVEMKQTPLQTVVCFPFPESIVQGLQYTKIWTYNIFKTLKRIVTGKVSADTLGGIITIGVVTYDRAEKGLINLLYFLAILSVNLAIINLLPIPVLDGGHLLFLFIEKIKGSPVSDRVVGVGHAIGLAIILALIVFVTFNDIQRWFFS